MASGFLLLDLWMWVCWEVLLWVILCSFLFVIFHLVLNTDVYAYLEKAGLEINFSLQHSTSLSFIF